MASLRLSDTLVAGLKAKSATYEIFDQREAGLSLRVTPAGTKTFCLLYRDDRRRFKRQTIGRFRTIGVDEARANARDLKRRAQALANGEIHNPDIRVHPSLRDALDDYEQKHLRINCPRSAQERMRVLRRDFSSLLDLKLERICKRHIFEITDAIMESGHRSAANHAFANIRAFMKWAVERGLIVRSACDGVRPPASVPSRS